MGKLNIFSSNAEQLKGVSYSAYIEKAGYTLLVRRTIYFVACFVALFLIWASLTTIKEVAISYGEVMPLEDVHVIQHLQGGIIKKIFVKNGDEVKKGQALIKLDPEALRAELQKAQSQEISLRLNAARLHAFINKIPLKLVDWNEILKNHPYNVLENKSQISQSIKEDENLLRQQNEERASQLAIYKEKIKQKVTEIKKYQRSKLEVQKRLALHQKEEQMFRSVVDKGYVSKRDYLAAQRKTIEATAQLHDINSRIDSATSELQEALKKLKTVFVKKASEELNAIDSEFLTVRHTIQRLSELNKRLLITAPIAGIIKGLTVSPGSVLSPAQGVLDIIPTKGKMIIHCRISTKDIGHVKVGDQTHIKVMAYEFTRYGSVPGHVAEISASTFTNEKGLPYYKAKVSLDKNYVGDNPKRNRLKPGMTVQVDIITGTKTVIAYLIKPITRGLKTAFRER